MPHNWRQLAWQRWQIINKAVGHLHAQAVTILFYFTILVPFGIGVRLFSDPLNAKKIAPQWLAREAVPHSLEDARRQF